MTEPIHDVARIAHAELLTPKPDESLRFFVDVLGMEEEARDGQSVFLRGWGDYLRYSLKLTESPQAGLGHVALRAWSPEALERRVEAIGETGLGEGWIDGDVGHGPAYRFTDPDGHVFELFYEAERYEAPEHLRPSWRNQPQRYVGRGAAVKRLDHVNVLAADVRANREFAQELLGYRLYERIELDDGSEQGAWLSLSIAAHELIYVADAYGANGRLHHLAFWVDTREECLRAADLFVDAGVPIEAAPSKHGVAQGFFLYGFEPGGNRIEVTTGGYFVYDPDFEPIVWTAAGARPRPVLGREDDRELPHVRHARRRRGGDRPGGAVTLHPDAQQFLDSIAESGAPPLTSLTPDEAREGSAFFIDLIGAGPDVAVVRDIEIPGPNGAIPARVYEPVPDPVGTVVYYHGGGWVLGCLDEFDAVCQALAVASGARVVSVDYRLAPEHRFPAAADDAFAALVRDRGTSPRRADRGRGGQRGRKPRCRFGTAGARRRRPGDRTPGAGLSRRGLRPHATFVPRVLGERVSS